MLPATALAPIQLRRGSWFVGENPNSGESLSWPGVLVQCFAESGYGELLAGNKRQEWSRAFCWSRWASEPHGKPHRSSRKNSQNAKDLGFSPLSLLPWLHFAPLVQSCSFSREYAWETSLLFILSWVCLRIPSIFLCVLLEPELCGCLLISTHRSYFWFFLACLFWGLTCIALVTPS